MPVLVDTFPSPVLLCTPAAMPLLLPLLRQTFGIRYIALHPPYTLLDLPGYLFLGLNQSSGTVPY
jgi:hypothetical protein